MPDFDNSLLGLMGISSGTCIGVKATKWSASGRQRLRPAGGRNVNG